MKNTNGISALLLILALSGCNRKVETNTGHLSVDVNPESVSVTFIELGSLSCVPCKMMQPIMEQIEIDFGEQVNVIFHDVWTDAGNPYAQKYGIQAIPTQIFLDKEGTEYYRHIGFFPQEELYSVIEQGLSIK